MRKTFYTFILLCIFLGNLYSLENNRDEQRPILSQYASNATPLSSHEEEMELNQSKKKIPYLTVGVISSMIDLRDIGIRERLFPSPPGIGISNRNNGKATDISVHPYIICNVLSISQSKIFYQHSLNTGSYFSVGAGGFIGNVSILPFAGVIVPLRMGYEGKNGFFDIGVELGGFYVVVPFIMPELRAGIKF
jgi:hypothetical protein